MTWKAFATGFGMCRHSGASSVREALSDQAYKHKNIDLDIKTRCLSGAADLKAIIAHESKQQNFGVGKINVNHPDQIIKILTLIVVTCFSKKSGLEYFWFCT